MIINFDWDASKRQGVISGDLTEEIREHFSVANDAAKFARYNSRFIPNRIYMITPTGRFDIGLFDEIEKFIVEKQYDVKLNYTNSFKKNGFSKGLGKKNNIALKVKLRDYQKAAVNSCIKKGAGNIVIATGGGKTLIIASLIEQANLYFSKKIKTTFCCLIVVPDLGLVNQTYSDFKQYEVNFTVGKWTGNNELDLSKNVIIANLGILQSSKSQTEWLQNIDLLIIDEVHKFRKGNKINKILKKIRTPHKFGFTGTLPENLIDQWNIIGKIGPVIYKKLGNELRKGSFIANVKAQIIKLKYITRPPQIDPSLPVSPTTRYIAEMDFIIKNNFRNNILCSLCSKFKNNSLLLIDYIEHGEILYEIISNFLKKNKINKDIYFIRGEVPIDDRDNIKQLMEYKNNIICIAISKIFSTGISINNLHYIVFAGAGKSKIKTLQSIGRGLRLHPNKDHVIIIDIADQLHYGRRHMTKRRSFYDEEYINYGTKTIKEKI